MAESRRVAVDDERNYWIRVGPSIRALVAVSDSPRR